MPEPRLVRLGMLRRAPAAIRDLTNEVFNVLGLGPYLAEPHHVRHLSDLRVGYGLAQASYRERACLSGEMRVCRREWWRGSRRGPLISPGDSCSHHRSSEWKIESSHCLLTVWLGGVQYMKQTMAQIYSRTPQGTQMPMPQLPHLHRQCGTNYAGLQRLCSLNRHPT